MADIKPLAFRGSALRDLKSFPSTAQRKAGVQLRMVQLGLAPSDWKPMTVIGSGVIEIRINDAGNAYRVIYLAKFANAIYVLHCFQKKSERTSKLDIDIGSQRFKELLKELRP